VGVVTYEMVDGKKTLGIKLSFDKRYITLAPVATLVAQPGWPLFAWIVLAIGLGSSWLATILWNMASQRLPASLCGQLIVSETLFALLYSFLWEYRWPTAVQWAAAALFTAGILASIKAHQ